MKIFILLIILLNFISENNSSDLSNVLSLTSNFFSNLNYHINDGEFNTKMQNFIDNQIDHYVELIKTSHGIIPKSKRKRNIFNEDIEVLSMDFIGVYVLNGFLEQTRIPVKHPKDIVLFKQDFGSSEIWYAATLEKNNLNKKHADNLIIYRYEEESYTEMSRISIEHGVKLSVHDFHGNIYITVVQKYEICIYLFNIDGSLYKIQTIDFVYSSDAVFWQQENDIFLAIGQEKLNSSTGLYYEVKSSIFKLIDKSFENVQNFNTSGVRKITPFKIGENLFLAVANHINDKGETEIFSEILKYDFSLNEFVSYQQILTHAVVDIQYFCFTQNNLQESFIVVANSYETDIEGNYNYKTESIVYKYIEDYFMPFQSFILNHAEQWLPVIGSNGEFILLVSLKNDGVKAFQYNGWRFIESEVQYTSEAFGGGIKSFRSYLYNTQSIIVVSNENDQGNMLNVFSPSFNYQNVMNEFQMDMHEWCQEITKEVDVEELKELNRLIEEAPKIDDLEILLNGNIYFHNITIENLVLNDENVKPRRVKKSNDVLVLEKQIKEKTNEIQELSKTLENNKEPIIFRGNVRVEKLEVIEDDKITFFEDLETKSINNVNMKDFFNDVIMLDDAFSLEEIEFEDVIFEADISPKFINDIPKSAFLHTASNYSLDTNLIVNGNIIVEDLIVDGYLDGLAINENNILLTSGNQNFAGSIIVLDLKAENVSTKYINNIDMMNLETNRIVNITDHNIDILTVKNISVFRINGINMNIFHDLVLRTRGDQEIISNYEFDTVIVDDFEVNNLLSNITISSLALISDSTNLLEQSLIFTQDLEIKTLHVIESMNKIPVKKGKLDILLRDHPNVQYISGDKKFDTINLSGPIQLRGQIKIRGLDPPIITKNLTLTGDYNITGDTIIDKLLIVGDLTEPYKKYSINRLDEHGLKLTDTEIPNYLDFTQGLNVDEIEVTTINDIDVNSWIVFENKLPQITGTKIFENLNVNGEVSISAINGENLQKLYDNILRIDSDQIITGKHTYSHISSIRVVSNKTILNNILWDNIMTLDGNQYINGTTIFTKPIKMSQFEATSAEVKGNIRKHNFDKMIADTAFNDTKNIVTGKKYFENNLIFKNLNASFINNASLHKLLSEINYWMGDIKIMRPINMEKIKVQNLQFNELNGIKKEDFGKIWLLKEGKQTVFEDQNFTKANFKQNLKINSKLINNIDFDKFNDLAVKTDENHRFSSANFVNGFDSQKSITVGGKVKNIDINDAFLTKDLKNQTILGNKIIFNNLTVHGYLHMNSLLSGINLRSLQTFTDSTVDRKQINLVIDGDINFKHEFNVNFLNSFDIEKLSQKAWFTDQKTKVTGYISFQNVIFEDELKVDGFVDDINLVWFSKNYFSKTKDQQISARLNFVDGILFAKDIKAENAIVSGLVANITLEDFNKHILRNDDQIFDFDAKFDNIEITGEFDSKLINNLDLSTDVVRNDVEENIVTGQKIIRNLNGVNLDISKGKTIQNVDVDDWFRNAVLLNGSFKIDAFKTLKNAKFEKNIKLQGLLNSYKFDEEHVVTTNTKQKIFGNKYFITSDNLYNSSLTFDALKLKGKYNDIVIDDLMKIQIDKSKEIVPISTSKKFHNTLTAENINIEKYYQGINIPDLIKNVTNLDKINNYAEEYNRLINFAKNVLTVLNEQSYILETFQQIQKINGNIHYVISLDNNNYKFGLVTKRNKILILTFFTWESDSFVSNNEFKIEADNEITFISNVLLNKKNYLCVEEQYDLNPDFSHLVTMYEISLNGNMENKYVMPTNKMKFLQYFALQNKNCVIVIQNDNSSNINCQNGNKFDLYQQIDIVDGMKVTVMDINYIPYLFILSSGFDLIKPNIQIWKYNSEIMYFISHDIISIENPSSIDTISYKDDYYLVVAVKQNIDTENTGLIAIYKYDEKTDKFIEWQKINVVDPTEVKFKTLSSDELVLYVISNCPAEPLVVYLYEGMSGFIKKYSTSGIPLVTTINSLIVDNNDFIVVSNENEVRIIKAVYRGKKYN